MKIIKSPEPIQLDDRPVIFLSGAIDQGTAENWQALAEIKFSEDNVILLNPRRENWDSNWEQSLKNTQLIEQINWEDKGLKVADHVLVVFTKDCKAPITLLELGTFNEKCVVVCPEGFYRYTNIVIYCQNRDIPLFSELQQGVDYLKSKI